MAQKPQKFHFVAYSATQEKGGNSNITSIKKHVMYDYFRKQGKDNAKQAAGKPKLAKSKRNNINHSHPDGSDAQLALDNALVNATKMLASATVNADFEQPEWFSRPRAARVQTSPGAHRSDPFDSFPVKQIPDGLINWFPVLYDGEVKNASWIHKSNVLWAQNIWQSSTHDQGLFYTVLSQAERNRMIMTNSRDSTRYLYLRGQALQALRKRISASEEQTPNGLILLIAYQIRFAIVEGDFDTARTHLQAAAHLIAKEGDKVGPFVMVHASLMDVKLAAASWTRPVLEFKDPHLRLQTSHRLAEVVRRRTETSLAHFPQDFRDELANEAMTGMHWHFLKFDAGYGKEIDGSFAVLLNCVRTARHLRALSADAWEKESVQKYDGTVRARTAIVLCIEFFAWMHDPAHIIPWITHSEYMKRLGKNIQTKLQHCFDPRSTSLPRDWMETGASRECLLWVLMICVVATSDARDDPHDNTDLSLPYVEALKTVMSSLQITDQLGLEQALKMFPWTDNLCGTWSKSLVARLELYTNDLGKYASG